jgi:hypothetical protein
MLIRIRFMLCLLALLVVAGCASTKVTRNENPIGPLPRPAHIWVYDLAASPADIPAESALAGQFPAGDSSQNAEHIAHGRKLGALFAKDLVKEIRNMGMPGEHLVAGSSPQVNDIILRGYIISFDEGSAAKRVTIGLGSGSSELKVAMEGFQVTPQGWRKIGGGSSDAGGSKGPGAAVGVAGLIATGNPAGLIISTGVKVYGEKSGKSKVEGRTEQTAKEVADILKKRFQEQGWI